MKKMTPQKLTFVAAIAIVLTAGTGFAVWASPCTIPTPDCPIENCDQ